MFKPCPNCGFLVALIAGREASQRCPRCSSALVGENETFDEPVEAPARRRRSESALHADVGEVPEAHASSSDHTADSAVELELRRDLDQSVGPDTDVPEVSLGRKDDERNAADAEVATAPHDGPSFARRRMRRGPLGRRWPVVAAVAALTLLLAMQLLLSQRVELARDARWRPVVAGACGVLGCEVPAWREPAAWRMLARGVRPDPKRPGVLHVTTTVRNDADWPQAPPVVVLSLSDVDGRLVGARSVAPREYGAARVQSIAPGQSIDVGFDVREPAGRVESFDFRLQ